MIKKQENNFTIAAVIVTYNRKALLKNNINMLLKQARKLDKIYIINNASTDGTEEMLHIEGYLSKSNIEIVNLHENIGGSGGFHIGTKIAYENNYDFIWLMDDDGKPNDENTLMQLVKHVKNIYNKNKKVLLNSLVLNETGDLSFSLPNIKSLHEVKQNSINEIILNAANPFNGTLVSKELIEAVGYPNRDFFIKGDENDFQNRCKNVNAYIATITTSIYFHPKLMKTKFKLFGKSKEAEIETPWKEYYRVRNYTYIYKKNKQISKLFKLFISRYYLVIFVKGKRFSRFSMITKGLFDGLFNRLGKRVSPKK